jgi:hypothetical protein
MRRTTWIVGETTSDVATRRGCAQIIVVASDGTSPEQLHDARAFEVLENLDSRRVIDLITSHHPPEIAG